MSSGTSASKHPERFHGAFTGGFSAGFFNSVGTAEGWTPSTFSSSRDKRAVPREQRPEDFMDDEDGLLTEQLQAKPAFDTLGSTAVEIARTHAEKEAAGSAIPGPAPPELVVPVGDPMGKKLLKTMGWRDGQGVGNRVRRKRHRPPTEGDDSPNEDLPEQAREGLGKKARELFDKEGLTFAPKNVNFKMQFVIAKTNLHGIGHEPFKDAPEFGAARVAEARGRVAGARSVYSTQDLAQHPNDGSAGVATKARLSRGFYAAAALDRGSHGFSLDDGEDDVYEVGLGKEAYDEALDEGTHDSLTDSAKAWALSRAGDDDEPMLASRRYARCPSDGRLPPTGFVMAQRTDFQPKHWAPPIPPANFSPTIEFEDDAVNPLRPSSQRHGAAGLNAPSRARMLGEPSFRPMTSTAAGPPVLVDEDKAHPPKGSSALSFLSPAAREHLLQAANGAGGLSRFSPKSGAAAAEHTVGVVGARRQENVSQQSQGLPFSLANKFTSSEKEADAKVDNASVHPVGGVDPSSRPAGLSIRPPATSDSSHKSSTAPASSENISRAKEGKNPVRRTIDWIPSALLCKRLNVPVPKAACAAGGWTMKGGVEASGPTASAPEQDVLGSLRQFVPESSASDQPKVPLLKGMEQRHPTSAVPASLSPVVAAAVVAEDSHQERPPIDLFKSIFESESESDSEEDDENGREETATVADQTDSAATAPPTHTLRAPEGLFYKTSLHRGYGTDSSDDESVDPGQLEADHRVGEDDSKSLEGGGRVGVGGKGPGGEKANSSRGSDSRTREHGSSSSSSRKRSSSKHGHKHKKRKKGKSDTKHRKHDHKRKKSRSSR